MMEPFLITAYDDRGNAKVLYTLIQDQSAIYLDDEIGFIYNGNNRTLCIALDGPFLIHDQSLWEKNGIHFGQQVIAYPQNRKIRMAAISRNEVVEVYKMEMKIREMWNHSQRPKDDLGRRPRPNLELLKKTGDIIGLVKVNTYEWGFDFSVEVSRAIEEMGESAIEPLIAALKDKDLSHQAAEGLFFISGSAVDALIIASQDEEAHVRKEAVWALE